jgi:hypothetical protein
MATEVRTDLVCAGNWQHAPGHPAVAFVSYRSEGIWEPCCDGCIQELKADDDPVPYHVAYLHDPAAGIGRPTRPDHDHGDPPDQPTPNHD